MAEDTRQTKLDFNTIKYWIDEVKSCDERFKKEVIERNAYPFLIKYYEGDQYGQTESQDTAGNKRKLAILNEYFPNTNQLISDIAYEYPEILAEPTKSDATGNAEIMKSVINWALRRLDAITENKVALFDMLYAGFCAVDVNHINKDVRVPVKTQGVKKGIIGKVKSVLGFEEAEEEVAKETPPEEYNYSTPDETYLRRLSPLNVILDYRAERVKDLRYVGKKIRMSMAEFNVRYPQFRGKVVPETFIPYTQHEDDSEKKCILLYEIQVRQQDDKYTTYVISPSYRYGEIDSWERPYATNGFNIKIQTLDEYGRLYAISRAKVNKGMQDDINNYTTFMMEVAERTIPKLIVDKNKVKVDAEEALTSPHINQIAKVEGDPSSAAVFLQPAKVSIENKELIGMFNQQKEKLWSVSATKLGAQSDVKFATELNVQEAGFMTARIGIQAGMRKLWLQEAETVKDIIVNYWDGPMFLKVAGKEKPDWYQPQIGVNPITGEEMVLNPLTELLTADYELNLDITTLMRPNKEKIKKDLIDFAQWLTSPQTVQFCQMQGYMVDISVIQKVAKEWGWNSEDIIKQLPPQPAIEEATLGMTPEGPEAEMQIANPAMMGAQ